MPDEDSDQLYVVLEVKEDSQRARADIKPLNTNLRFPPINTVRLEDLEVVEVDTSDLIGHQVSIITPDNKEVAGEVIDVKEEKLLVNLTQEENGVRLNVELTIKDKKGDKHSGNLIIN
jgi:hypothetical protein